MVISQAQAEIDIGGIERMDDRPLASPSAKLRERATSPPHRGSASWHLHAQSRRLPIAKELLWHSSIGSSHVLILATAVDNLQRESTASKIWTLFTHGLLTRKSIILFRVKRIHFVLRQCDEDLEFVAVTNRSPNHLLT